MTTPANTVHLASLSFSGASTMARPTTERCLELAGEIITDGSLTAREPLVLNGFTVNGHRAGSIPRW
eukprot:133012-Lingulodinium_polyedra.AAC.1